MKETWIKMEQWMKTELGLMVVFMLSGSTMVNVMNKMQGMLFTLATISVFMILIKASGLLLPLVRNISTSAKYLALVILGYVDIAALSLYGTVDNSVWLSINILLDIPFNIVLSAFFIDYDVILKDLTSTKMFTEMQYLERIVFSAVGIIGGGLTYVLALYLSIGEIVSVVVIIKFFSSFIVLYQYINTYKGLNIIDEDKEDPYSSIYLKKTLNEYRAK